LNVELLEDRFAPAVFNVNSLADILNPPSGTVTLRSAIKAANATPGGNTINLTLAGTYKITLLGANEDNSAGEFAILPAGGDLTIANTSGGAVVVDGGGYNRVFDLNPDVFAIHSGASSGAFTVTFDGITIAGGNAMPFGSDNGSGGGIRSDGASSIVLNNVVLNDNAATTDGGGIAMSTFGYNPPPGVFSASWFVDNTGSITLHNSTISHNHAGQAGGGVETEGSGPVLIDTGTVIDYNTSVSGGGGIFDAGTGDIAITSCLMHDNFAGLTGGAYSDASIAGTVRISQTLFFNKTAWQNGGAVASNGPNTLITGCVFQGNTSQGMGGGLLADGQITNVTDTIFRENTSGRGGGVEDTTSDFLNVKTSTFDSNRAIGGDGSNGSAGPGAGGGIDMQGNSSTILDIENSLFLDNLATSGNGGAINESAGLLVIADSQFTANSAANMGGAVAFKGRGFAASGSTFNHNSAENGGGVDYENTGTVATLSDSVMYNDTFVGNVATAAGGAILDAGLGDLLLLYDTINNNTAGINGGGCDLTNGSFTFSFHNAIVFGNTAGVLGPDIFTPAGYSITDEGGNLIGTTSGTSGFGAGTLVGVNPLLDALEDNGGQLAGAAGDQRIVQTEALLRGSPVIFAGTSADGIHSDERGFSRSTTGPQSPTIGAYEPQYSAGTSANQLFVENLYETLLGRTADSTGLQAWTDLLNQGASPSSIVQAIENSAEYRADEVYPLYQRYLNRPAVSSEVQMWENDLQSGETIEQVTASILGSDEYFQLHGSNNLAFLDALYEDTLGRSPDVVGIDAFSQMLAQGESRSAVAALVLNSTEYRTDLIESEYQTILGRKADQSGLLFFLGELSSGTTQEQMVAAILGSPEAFQART